MAEDGLTISEGTHVGNMRCYTLDAHGQTEIDRRIAELEAALRIGLDAYSRVSSIALPGDVAGALVHARENMRRALWEI